MAGWLILTVGVVYLITATDFLVHNRMGMCLVFVGYALANLGFWLDVK